MVKIVWTDFLNQKANKNPMTRNFLTVCFLLRQKHSELSSIGLLPLVTESPLESINTIIYH